MKKNNSIEKAATQLVASGISVEGVRAYWRIKENGMASIVMDGEMYDDKAGAMKRCKRTIKGYQFDPTDKKAVKAAERLAQETAEAIAEENKAEQDTRDKADRYFSTWAARKKVEKQKSRAERNAKYGINRAATQSSKINTIEDIMAELTNGEDILLTDINKAFVLRFIAAMDARGYKQGTKAAYFQAFSGVLTMAVDGDALSHNPCADIPKNKRPTLTSKDAKKVNPLTAEELERLAATPMQIKTHAFTAEELDNLRRAFLLSCYCGLRYVDIMTLTWRDLTFAKDGKVYLEREQVKTGSEVSQRLTVKAVQQLPERPAGAKKTDRVFKLRDASVEYHSVLERWGKQAGIEGLHFHRARHTFGTLSIEQGLDIHRVSSLLGHTALDMTLRYADYTKRMKDDAADLLDKAQ